MLDDALYKSSESESISFAYRKPFQHKGPIIFCVCGGEVNFERGNRKKADLIKGGIKFGRNMVRGERNYEFFQGGNTFFDNQNL